MGQRSSSDVQLTSETDMRVQMSFFGQSNGCQTVLFLKSTRSSANSSRIKSYDCLKLTLFFQLRNDFMDFLQEDPRSNIQDGSDIYPISAQTHASKSRYMHAFTQDRRAKPRCVHLRRTQ